MSQFIPWFDIPSSDFDRAVDFYSYVFNMSFEKIDCGTEKMACFPNGLGSIFYDGIHQPANGGVIIHITVNSIEDTCKRIEEKGGKIIMPKTKIQAEGRGYFALFLDTEGNKLGIYQD